MARNAWEDAMHTRRNAVAACLVLSVLGGSAIHAQQPPTTTPIRHLIVVVGENITFDNLFATWEPKSGAGVHNLLSEGIVNRDGSPGAHFEKAIQRRAQVRDAYTVTPAISGTYGELPQPGTTYAKNQPHYVGDKRFPELLPNGPFQITKHADFAAHVGDPVHRFFQMWQQIDGGKLDLFVWVAETSGEGSRNRADPSSGTMQGGVAMGFYNMAAGDAPYFHELADRYAVSDNHHQPVMGGTGANFQALATGHAIAYVKDGKFASPPSNQIENPNPRAGTNNWYEQSGYTGGSYTHCADPAAPGAKAIRAYLAGLPYKAFNDGNCEPGAYYLVNNYSPGYMPNGEAGELGAKIFRIPPQTQPTIAEALSAKGVSWKWYSGGRNGDGVTDDYCDVCDPLTYSSAIMTTALKTNLQDHAALFRDLASETSMPAVAFVIPPDPESGHPAYSTVSRYEEFVRGIITRVQADKALWDSTAIIVTVDEGGGYWDSGAIQTLDFFGDGTRIPLLLVSRFAKPGHVDHTYTDHISILKFIEANWKLKPLSARSRDHLPNPVADPKNPYLPANPPAIGDLMPLFAF
jgi:phospholipase C